MRGNRALGFFVVCIAVWSIATWARLWLGRPTSDDIVRAAKMVRQGFKPGDLALVVPGYASRIAEQLGDLPLATFRRPVDEDYSRWKRLWIVSPFGEIPDAVASRFPGAERMLAGRVAIGLHQLPPPARVLFDFRARLAEATVWIERGRDRRSCTLAGRVWTCGPEDWNTVGADFLEVVDEPRQVIWAHPVDYGIKTLLFTDVPLGRELWLWTGFHGAAVDPRVASVSLAVDIDGREIARQEQRPTRGWTRSVVSTGEYSGAHEVRFRVLPVADPRRCHFVFHAEVRE